MGEGWKIIGTVGVLGLGAYVVYRFFNPSSNGGSNSPPPASVLPSSFPLFGPFSSLLDWLNHPASGNSGNPGSVGHPISPLPNPLTGSGGYSPLFGPIGDLAGSLPIPTSFPLFGPFSAVGDWISSIFSSTSNTAATNPLTGSGGFSSALFSPIGSAAPVAPTVLISPDTNPNLYAPIPSISPAYNGGQFDLGGGVYGGTNNGNAYIDIPPHTNYSGGGSSSTWHEDPFNPGYGFFA